MVLRKLNLSTFVFVIFTMIVGWGPGASAEDISAGAIDPRDLVETPDGEFLYIACGNEGQGVVTVLRLSDNAIVDTVSVGCDPLEIAITPNGQFVYVSNTVNGYYTSKIDVASNVKLVDIHGGTDPAGIAITPDGSTACIVSHWTSSLQLLDVVTDVQVGSIPGISHGGLSIVVTPDGQFAYVTARYTGPNPGSGLLKVSLSAEEVVANIPFNGDGIAITPDGEEIWVSGPYNSDKVYVVSTLTDTVIDSVAVGEFPIDVAISPDGSYAYVLSRGDESLNKISISDRNLVRTINVGSTPRRVALSTDGSRAFVANMGSNTISIIDLIIPQISTISDIPNDQGRQVRTSWDNCYHDNTESLILITEYAIYRKIDYNLSASEESSKNEKNNELNKEENGRGSLFYPPGDWDYIVSVPACAEQEYWVVVPTLADSTISEGMYYSTFFIRALTPTPGVYFDSPPDSGYSVDNLAPGAPLGFSVAYNTGNGNELSWEESEEEDFKYYRVYRSKKGFEPDSVVHSTADTQWQDTVDEGWKYHYKITSIDFSGNESDPAAPDVITGSEMPDVPAAFTLHQNYPNPFNPVTTIRFDLPTRRKVYLSIYDVNGKRVRILLNKEMTVGQKSVDWNGRSDEGRDVASGIYFYCLKTGEFEETRKMILMR